MTDYQLIHRMAVTEKFEVRMLYHTVPMERKLRGRKYRGRKISVELIYDKCHQTAQNEDRT